MPPVLPYCCLASQGCQHHPDFTLCSPGLCWTRGSSRAGFCGGRAALFTCHLVQNWTRLLQGYPRGVSSAQWEFCLNNLQKGPWGFVQGLSVADSNGEGERQQASLSSLVELGVPDLLKFFHSLPLWDFCSLAPALLLGAVPNTVLRQARNRWGERETTVRR